MRALIILVWGVILCFGESNQMALVQPQESGMSLGWTFHINSADDQGIDNDLEVEDENSNDMKRSSEPENDVHEEEDTLGMDMFSENSVLGEGTRGDTMVLSGPTVPISSPADDSKGDLDDDESQAVSISAPSGANLFGAKEEKISEMRSEIDQSKFALDQQTTNANQLLREATTKQAYLDKLQKEIMEQTVALEKEKNKLKSKEQQVDSIRGELEKKAGEINRQIEAQNTDQITLASIESQIEGLETKKKEIENSFSKEESILLQSQDELDKLQEHLNARDEKMDKREKQIKGQYSEINSNNKESQKLELKIRQEQQQLKKQRAGLQSKIEALKKQEPLVSKQLESRLSPMIRPVVNDENEAQKLIGESIAVQTSAQLKPTSIGGS